MQKIGGSVGLLRRVYLRRICNGHDDVLHSIIGSHSDWRRPEPVGFNGDRHFQNASAGASLTPSRLNPNACLLPLLTQAWHLSAIACFSYV